MAQKTEMLNELTQYMYDCDLNYKSFNRFDFELLVSFLEEMFKSHAGKIVIVKFRKHNILSNNKFVSVYITEDSKCKQNIILFKKDGSIEIPKTITKKESEIAKISFMKWCDFLYFENAGGKKYEYRAKEKVWG